MVTHFAHTSTSIVSWLGILVAKTNASALDRKCQEFWTYRTGVLMMQTTYNPKATGAIPGKACQVCDLTNIPFAHEAPDSRLIVMMRSAWLAGCGVASRLPLPPSCPAAAAGRRRAAGRLCWCSGPPGPALCPSRRPEPPLAPRPAGNAVLRGSGAAGPPLCRVEDNLSHFSSVSKTHFTH